MWHPLYQPKGQWNAEDYRSIDRSGNSSTKDKSVLIDTNRIVRKRTLSQSETDGTVDCFSSYPKSEIALGKYLMAIALVPAF